MYNLTLRQLQIAQAVMKEGKIAKAAQRLGLTSPAVTLQIQQIESELGESLFVRSREGVSATAFGHAVVDTAMQIEMALEQLEQRCKEIRGLKAGRLRIGAVSTGKYFVPHLMAGYRKLYPEIDLGLFIGNRHEVIEKLSQREFDVAFMGRPPHNIRLNALIIGEHPMGIIAPIDHPLAKIKNIPKARLAKEHFLMREQGSGTRMSLEQFLRSVPNKGDNFGTEMASNETIKQAVIAGLGIALLSLHTVEQELLQNRLAILDCQGMPLKKQWFLISRQDQIKTPAVLALEEFIKEEGEQYLPKISEFM